VTEESGNQRMTRTSPAGPGNSAGMADPATPLLTDRFLRAVAFAGTVHATQVRKGTSTPYLAHLLSVAALVLEHGGSEDAAIAGLLHDSAEDSGDGAGTRAILANPRAVGPALWDRFSEKDRRPALVLPVTRRHLHRPRASRPLR